MGHTQAFEEAREAIAMMQEGVCDSLIVDQLQCALEQGQLTLRDFGCEFDDMEAFRRYCHLQVAKRWLTILRGLAQEYDASQVSPWAQRFEALRTAELLAKATRRFAAHLRYYWRRSRREEPEEHLALRELRKHMTLGDLGALEVGTDPYEIQMFKIVLSR